MAVPPEEAALVAEPVAGRETPPPPPAEGFWALVREALRGSSRDLTAGSIGKSILVLAVPMVMEMAMESIFAVCDVFFVGKLGKDAVATVGLTESMMAILYAVAMGLAIGATAVVARRIGEKNPERAARAAVQALALGIGVSIPIAVGGAFFARPLLELMGGSPWVLEHGTRYAQVLLGGSSTIMLLFLVNAIFRGAGDAAIAMRTLWLANGINIALGPCLIFGLGPFPRLGVAGAATATTIGRGVGVLYQLWSLSRGRGRIRVGREHLALEPATMLGMLRLAGAGTVQAAISSASWVFLVRIVSGFGSAAVAGYTIAIRIVLFALLPSWGLANAAATMVGQGLGAGKPERAQKAVWTAAAYNLAFLGAVGALFIAFANPLIDAFAPDAEAAGYAVLCLRIVSAGFLFYAVGMVLTQAFNGAGDTFTPTVINLLCFWILEIPLAWALARPLGFGPSGAYAAVAVAFSLVALVSGLVFRRGKWKTRAV